MNKTESIARKILGWKLNSSDRWYDSEQSVFINTSDFQPEEHLDHAMLIVKRLEKFGFQYTTNGVSDCHFNEVSATGDTLAEAITNAAYSIVGENSIVDSSKIWQQLC
ncbi:hypothetical protein RJD24_09240 [Bacillaceae bacterium IKA-2]|jgi:capsid portal protein|nr:hypothetical protein RJD24_09240 [Bacillaceae bacterium IKA-2]